MCSSLYTFASRNFTPHIIPLPITHITSMSKKSINCMHSVVCSALAQYSLYFTWERTEGRWESTEKERAQTQRNTCIIWHWVRITIYSRSCWWWLWCFWRWKINSDKFISNSLPVEQTQSEAFHQITISQILTRVYKTLLHFQAISLAWICDYLT